MHVKPNPKVFEKVCLNCGPQIWEDPAFIKECTTCNSPCKQHIQKSIIKTKINEDIPDGNINNRIEQRIAKVKALTTVNLC